MSLRGILWAIAALPKTQSWPIGAVFVADWCLLSSLDELLLVS